MVIADVIIRSHDPPFVKNKDILRSRFNMFLTVQPHTKTVPPV